MTLYELGEQYLALLDLAGDPDVDEEVFRDTLEGVAGELEEKADAYAKIMAELTGQADVIGKEIERLTARKKTLEANTKAMRERLKTTLEGLGKTSLKTELFTFSVRKNPPSLKIDRPDEIPEAYRIPQPDKIDTTKIKADIKAGLTFDWCHTEQGTSLAIK